MSLADLKVLAWRTLIRATRTKSVKPFVILRKDPWPRGQVKKFERSWWHICAPASNFTSNRKALFNGGILFSNLEASESVSEQQHLRAVVVNLMAVNGQHSAGQTRRLIHICTRMHVFMCVCVCVQWGSCKSQSFSPVDVTRLGSTFEHPGLELLLLLAVLPKVRQRRCRTATAGLGWHQARWSSWPGQELSKCLEYPWSNAIVLEDWIWRQEPRYRKFQ